MLFQTAAAVLLALLPAAPGEPPAPGEPAADPPTFARDVAPVLFARCTACHRAGEIGPFALETYADARRRSRQLAEITEQRVMPPWKPVDGHGAFRHDRSLTDEQIALFRRWHDAGAPEGDPADRPPRPDFPTGWHLGEPDLILEVPEEYAIPAEGDDVYVHFVLPTGFWWKRHVRAVQVLPSNKAVAHHAVVMLDAAGGAASKLAAEGGGRYVRFGDPGFLPRGFLPGYAPGMTTRPLPKDQPITVDGFRDVVLQMHYHPTGKPEVDRPRVGLYFTRRPPKRNHSVVLMANDEIDIPAGEADYRREDAFTLPVDYEVRSVFAHMHMIGRSVRVWAELPGGGERKMLLIDDWDYRWQDTYAYEEPFTLPAGTTIRAEFRWDNSSAHVRNPNHPPRRIRWGPGSTDEMSGLVIGGLPVRPHEEWKHWLAVLGHYAEVKEAANAAKRRR